MKNLSVKYCMFPPPPPSTRVCVYIISLFFLGSVRKNGDFYCLLIIGQKGCFVSGRFVSTDVLSPRTFCLYGRFVSTDVLSLGTFCPHGNFVPRKICLRPFCLRTFCLRMFCPYGRFVSGRFVWAPFKLTLSQPCKKNAT
jgi:hypothetical protein